MPSVALVIKSYPPDYPWLAYCLRSIQKFCTGFREIIVMLPREHTLPLTKEAIVLMDAPESYLSQQVSKLNADMHTQADFLVHFDSDCIFTRPVTPDYFLKNGKAIWAITPFAKATHEQQNTWLHPMVKCLRVMPEFEYMRKNAIIAPRFIYAEFRDFIFHTHGMTMEQYVMSQPNNEFSEYNCLGFYAWLTHRDKIHWHDTEKDGIPDWPWIQHWSLGGLTPQIQEQYERILS